MRPFIALIHKDADRDYGVSFPDLPGCITAGSTLEEARAFAEEALSLHIRGMVEDGDPVPEPSSLDAIMADRENRDGVAILVDVKSEAIQAVRIAIILPEDVLERIDRYASQHGFNRSGFLTHAAERAMEVA